MVSFLKTLLIIFVIAECLNVLITVPILLFVGIELARTFFIYASLGSFGGVLFSTYLEHFK